MLHWYLLVQQETTVLEFAFCFVLQRVTGYLDGITTLTATSLTDIEMVSSTISKVVANGEDVDSRGKVEAAPETLF